MAAEGTLTGVDNRIRARATVALPQASADRFVACTLVSDVENQKMFYRRMEAHETKYNQAQAAKHYDKYAETKKLRLLHEKKQLLQRLVDVNTSSLLGPRAPSSTSSRAPSSPSAHSSFSRCSSTSKASWATFAPREVQGTVLVSRMRPSAVPKLELN